jgi:hypothetical protein
MTTPNPTNAPPGSEVVCVRTTDAPKWASSNPLRVGLIYTVDGWGMAEDIEAKHQTLCIILREIPQVDGNNVGFVSERFRLLHRAASPSYYETQRELEDA